MPAALDGTGIKLPKYVQTANKILETIAAEPNRTWNKTQRELGEVVGISLPELSNLIKTLVDAGRIRKGDPLGGYRGRTFCLEIINDAPITSAIRRDINRDDDRSRVLATDEAVTGPVAMNSLTVEQIGYGVINLARRAWESDERLAALRSEHLARTRELREQLLEERTTNERLTRANIEISKELEQRKSEIGDLRAQINTLLIKMNTHSSNGGTFKIRDMLGDSEIAQLEELMKTKPGHYRETDREVGLID